MDAILFQPETSMRRALILVLGPYRTEELPSVDRQPLINKLLNLYRNMSEALVEFGAGRSTFGRRVVRSANLYYAAPSYRNANIGFRPARTLP